jgi:prepilin-type N-terminal cleavage/methylation domain-containing protein
MSDYQPNKFEAGFTLLETIIVLALIGFLTIFVVSGSGNGIRNERFSGGIRDIVSNLRDAQTKSYTVKTGNGCADQDTGPGGGLVCFWRGNVVTFAVGGPDTSYNMNLLYGADLSASTGFNSPQSNIYGISPVATATYSLSSFKITNITVGGTSVSSVAVAFLAPDGHSYSCDTSHNVAGCTPSRTSNPNPYANSGDVVLSISDTATPHTGTVTISSSDGTISTIIQ